MKIGIIGVGVVGGAILEGLKIIDANLDIIGYDKYKNIGSFKKILETDILFVCVPTKFSEQTNQYNKTELQKVLNELNDNKYCGIILIKCTVEPRVSQELADNYELKIIHNPEFLSASTNIDDFVKQDHIVIGKTSNINDNDLKQITNFYSELFPNAVQSICNSTESECMKIFVNNYYSVKIQFCNELYLLCNKLNVEYDNVMQLMLKNKWIHPMHTKVPGTDGLLSYGGMCFPKDTNALLEVMKKENTSHEVLEACINERNKMRDDHVNVDLKKE